jgi:hypothetical protein
MTQGVAARRVRQQDPSLGEPTSSLRSSRCSTSSTEARPLQSSWWASLGSARRASSRSWRLVPSCVDTLCRARLTSPRSRAPHEAHAARSG